MARISSFLLLFTLSAVLGFASAKTRNGQIFEGQGRGLENDQAWGASNMQMRSKRDDLDNPFELTTRGVIDSMRNLIRDILQNIIIAIDCYLKTPTTKSQQEQYKKVAEGIKQQLMKSLEN